MFSFSTTYTCPACHCLLHVSVTDLGDPYQHISENSRTALRGIRDTTNKLGVNNKPGDPVDDLAQTLLEQEARSELRYATCPKCSAKNPEGVAAIQDERRKTLLFGGVFFGILAALAWFYPWVALLLPGLDLLVFRPMMVVQIRKNDKPFPVVPFVAGVVLDLALIALILLYPRTAPLVPVMGIIQSLFSGSGKHDWKWDEAAKKLQFDAPGDAAP